MNSRFSVIKLICVIAIGAALFGCSSANSDAPSPHPANWSVGHRAAYREAFALNQSFKCRECHGNDLTNGEGGITKINCTTTCHYGNHVPRIATHLLPYTLHSADAKANIIACQACHGTAGGAGSNPSFSGAIGSLPKGCATCHINTTLTLAHPKPWLTHNFAGNMGNACRLCHGVSYDGVNSSGPSCKKCHLKATSGFQPASGCVSCHNNPPDSNVAPNNAGSHAIHLALSEVNNNCQVCHIGGGTGSQPHYDNSSGTPNAVNVTVGVMSAFNAKSGAVTYDKDGLTCTNVACHGGQKTTPWIDPVSGSVPASIKDDCKACHSDSPNQYNSYATVRHQDHATLQCTNCHETSKITKHFKNFSTHNFNTLPSSTIQTNTINYSSTAKTCTFGNNSLCHPGDVKVWN